MGLALDCHVVIWELYLHTRPNYGNSPTNAFVGNHSFCRA